MKRKEGRRVSGWEEARAQVRGVQSARSVDLSALCLVPATRGSDSGSGCRPEAKRREAFRDLCCALGAEGAVPTGHCSLYAWSGADPSLTLGDPVFTLAPQVQSHGEPGRNVSVCLGSRADHC